MDKVAVIIPTYDRRKTLFRCMAHLSINLKGVDLCFYIGNDHSDPLRLEYFQEVGRETKIFNEPTGSLGANINRLILEARRDGHEFLFQLDDDHILQIIKLGTVIIT